MWHFKGVRRGKTGHRPGLRQRTAPPLRSSYGERPMSLALNTSGPGGPSRLDLLFDRIATWAPFAAGFISWVRQPSSRLVRIPLAFLLIFGGIFSFLPI